MEFSGITEILGTKGTGKTTYILNYLKEFHVAYFTSKKIPLRVLENIYTHQNTPLSNLNINPVFDIFKLKHIYKNLIIDFVQNNNIQAIVIDTLDSLFTTIHEADKKNELFPLFEEIKRVCFECRISTFVIQEFPMKSDPFRSYVIRYDIKYMINKQLSFIKKNGIYSMTKIDFVSGEKMTKRFTILGNIIHYLEN